MNVVEIKHKWNGNLKYGNKPVKIIVHHSASKTGDAPTFHKWHTDWGWVGIGYHYVILKDGTIQRGRPETAIGAHTKGHNSNSIGICCVGYYHGNKEKSMPEAQKEALVELIRNIRKKYSPSMKIYGHRDFNATSCPGDNFPFAEIVALVDKKDEPAPTPNPTPIVRTLYKGIKGDDVKTLQSNLIELGYSVGKTGADSSFGDNTDKAVRLFQEDNGLEVDGRVGPATRAKLKELLALPVKTVNTKVSPLNLRKSVGGKVISTIPRNSKVRILKDGEWCYVMYGRLRGYALRAYLV